jgi:NADH-quinone oxidoreductase subunit G
VAFNNFADMANDVAHVMLPIAPFTETAGTLVNCEGRVQTYNAVVKPLGEARPGWKVLRVLGNLLGLKGFDQETIDDVRAELPALNLNNASIAPIQAPSAINDGFERFAETPIYAADCQNRRASALQATCDAKTPILRMNPLDAEELHLSANTHVQLKNASSQLVCALMLDKNLARRTLRIPQGLPQTANLSNSNLGWEVTL